MLPARLAGDGLAPTGVTLLIGRGWRKLLSRDARPGATASRSGIGTTLELAAEAAPDSVKDAGRAQANRDAVECSFEGFLNIIDRRFVGDSTSEEPRADGNWDSDQSKRSKERERPGHNGSAGCDYASTNKGVSPAVGYIDHQADCAIADIDDSPSHSFHPSKATHSLYGSRAPPESTDHATATIGDDHSIHCRVGT